MVKASQAQEARYKCASKDLSNSIWGMIRELWSDRDKTNTKVGGVYIGGGSQRSMLAAHTACLIHCYLS